MGLRDLSYLERGIDSCVRLHERGGKLGKKEVKEICFFKRCPDHGAGTTVESVQIETN